MAGKVQRNVSIKTLWGLAKSPELRLTDEELHLIVAAHTGKDSIRALNKKELEMLIRLLGNMKQSAKGNRAGNPSTQEQRKKIYVLARKIGWDNPARVDGLCRRMFRVDRVEWLNGSQCSQLIEALKDMGERQEGRRETADGKK